MMMMRIMKWWGNSMMKDCRGSVIWQSDQWMRGQIGIDCDRLVNGQPWSWLMTLNLNLIWSTHNNTLSSRQKNEADWISFDIFVSLPSPRPPRTVSWSHYYAPIQLHAEDTDSALVTPRCQISAALFAQWAALGLCWAAGQHAEMLGATLYCATEGNIIATLLRAIVHPGIVRRASGSI